MLTNNFVFAGFYFFASTGSLSTTILFLVFIFLYRPKVSGIESKR